MVAIPIIVPSSELKEDFLEWPQRYHIRTRVSSFSIKPSPTANLDHPFALAISRPGTTVDEESRLVLDSFRPATYRQCKGMIQIGGWRSLICN
jgi:hypothetical protein